MKRLLAFFRSVKLAIILVSYIAVSSVFASVFPQRSSIAAAVPEPWRAVVAFFQPDNFFSSAFFFVPVTLLAANLLVCTVDRIVRRLRAKASLRMGPDIIHAGLLALIAGGLVTFAFRTEERMLLEKGATWTLSCGTTIQGSGFNFSRYPDGRPSKWVAHVRVIEDDRVLFDDFGIEVNKPLSVNGASVYLLSYETGIRVTLGSATGEKREIGIGDIVNTGDRLYVLEDAAEKNGIDGATFSVWKKDKTYQYADLGAGDSVGGFSVESVSVHYTPRLLAASDPGGPLIGIAFALIAIGFAVTYIKKQRGEKK